MRLSRRNSWKRFWIGSYQGERILYDTDSDGNVKYTTVDGESVPVETGIAPAGYKIEGMFRANFTMSGGEAEAAQYGIDVSGYSAKIVVPKGILTLYENDLLWEDEPEVDDNLIADGKTASYKIVRVSPSRNFVAYLLDRIAAEE